MCDYSLEAVKSRAAVKGDKLITTNFGRGTSGFRPADEQWADMSLAGTADAAMTAVCVLPGTELAFDAPVEVRTWTKYGTVDGVYCPIEHPAKTIDHTVARFAKINQDNHFTHHDGLEFPDTFGVDPVLLTHLVEGQTVTVIQMPTAGDERHEQRLAKALDGIDIKAPEYTD